MGQQYDPWAVMEAKAQQYVNDRKKYGNDITALVATDPLLQAEEKARGYQQLNNNIGVLPSLGMSFVGYSPNSGITFNNAYSAPAQNTVIPKAVPVNNPVTVEGVIKDQVGNLFPDDTRPVNRPPVRKASRVDQDVLNFQKHWNKYLPEGATPLVEDGIRGPKTEFAEKQWANAARALEYGSPKPTAIAQPMVVPAASESLAAQAPRREVPDWARGTILEFTGQY